MSAKMKGVEFNAYYNDDEYWEKGAWHDDHCVKVNGEYREELDENIPDDADVVIESGTVYIPVAGESGAEEKDIPLVTHFKNWRKKNNFSFIVVIVKKDKASEVREALKNISGVMEVKGN